MPEVTDIQIKEVYELVLKEFMTFDEFNSIVTTQKKKSIMDEKYLNNLARYLKRKHQQKIDKQKN